MLALAVFNASVPRSRSWRRCRCRCQATVVNEVIASQRKAAQLLPVLATVLHSYTLAAAEDEPLRRLASAAVLLTRSLVSENRVIAAEAADVGVVELVFATLRTALAHGDGGLGAEAGASLLALITDNTAGTARLLAEKFLEWFVAMLSPETAPQPAVTSTLCELA